MARRRGKTRPKEGRIRGAVRRLLRALGLALLLTVVGFAAWLAWTWPDVGAVASGPVTRSAFIDAYAAAAGRRPEVQWRDYADIDDDLKLAVLVAEDARFFEHGAFDPRELGEALEDHLLYDRPLRGASTLTQQLAKNLWLSTSQTVVRKGREALYAVALERRMGKRRIFEVYLNVAQMGPGVFGAEAAARRFFGTGADDLTPGQAAELAAALSRPSVWHPGVTSASYARRVEHILSEMERSPGVAEAL